MSPALRAVTLWVFAALGLCAGAQGAQLAAGTAQSPTKLTAQPATGPKKPAFRSECVAAVGLCVSVPGPWQRVGNVFDDLGFVAAEPHPGADPAGWPQLTILAFEPPAPVPSSNSGAVPAGEQPAPAPPSLDALVDRMLTPAGPLASAQTIARSRLVLNGSPAQTVRVQFHDEAGRATAIEEVALIEGNEGMVYSVALRCAPQEFERLEPVFQQAARSWRIRQAAAAPPSNKPATPSSKPPAGLPAVRRPARIQPDSGTP